MSATDVNRLAEPLRTLVKYAMARGRRDGKTVTLVSGLRTREQQIALRRAHCGNSQYGIYERPASQCTPPTARPGTSNHESGNAADLGGAKEWVATLLSPYGVTRPVRGEDWHFEYRGSKSAAQVQADVANAMRRDGFSDAEISAVVGGAIDTSGGNPFSWALDAVTGAPGAAFDAVTGAVPNPLDALAPVGAVVGRMIDPGWWRRVGLGAAGLAIVAIGIMWYVRNQSLEVMSNV